MIPRYKLPLHLGNMGNISRALILPSPLSDRIDPVMGSDAFLIPGSWAELPTIIAIEIAQ